jgi:nitrous oxidase accessory protein NosD
MARKRKTQLEKVRDFLFTGKRLTAKTAINRFGVYRLAAIIWTLRHTFSMNISTDNSKGYATYFLVTK